jgi:predicted transcriptional regulator of viral defense system
MYHASVEVKEMGRSLEAYISREIPNIFKEYSLVAVNEILPGQIEADFHLKDKDGNDVFMEVTGRKLGHTKLNQILNMYAAISNIEPPLKKFELLVIAPEVTPSVKKELAKLPVKLLTYKQIGITDQKLRKIKEQDREQQKSLSPSPEEAKLIAKWESEKKTTIRASDVQEALDCSLDYAYYLLHNLERKNWIERVTQGLYQFIPLSYGYPERIPPSNSFIIGASLIKPDYFSYYTSNSHYGFTTQMPYTLFIATTKKKPEITWEGRTFKFITLSKQKFFGYKKEQIFEHEVTMAEPEKSLVDSFDKPKYAGGIEQLARIVWRGFPQVKKEKLVNYALRMNSHALIQRMGFTIDYLTNEQLIKPLPQNLRDKLLKKVGKTAIYLDSRKPKTGTFSKEWNIINNLPREQLLSEIEVR